MLVAGRRMAGMPSSLRWSVMNTMVGCLPPQPLKEFERMTSTKLLAPALLCVLFRSTDATADARDEITSAFQKAMGDSTYRLHIEIENKRGPISSQIDVQMPDRFHMRSQDAEFIMIPGGTWINAGGRWMKMPVDMSKQMQGYKLDDISAATAQIESVEKIGSEVVDGCESTLYRYATTSTFAGRRSDDEVELAVCDATGLPARLRSTPKRKGDAVVIRYDFDAAIDIRPPQ